MVVAHNLIAAFGRQAPQHEYLITVPSGLGYEEICEGLPRCQVEPYRHTGGVLAQFLYEQFRLPKLVKAFSPDVVLALGNRGMLRPPCAQAIYIKDARFCYPARYHARDSFVEKLKIWMQRKLIRRQLRKAQVMLCQTRVMERRLVEAFGYKGMTFVCPKGVSTSFLDCTGQPPLPEPLARHADKMRLLYVSKYYANKNFEGLIELFSSFPEELRDVVVVITLDPKQSVGARRLLKVIEHEGLQDRIVNVGALRQSELPAYYQHSHAMLMPSLLESFSSTYLEAMHFGLPILASDLDFAREICGEAALYFDPWDVESIKQAILRLKSHPELAAELAARGRERLPLVAPTWDKIAHDLLSVLDGIASKTK